MGGFGSGSYSRLQAHAKAESCRRYDLADLRRWSFLDGEPHIISFESDARGPQQIGVVASSQSVRLFWKQAGAIRESRISYVTTATAFGGVRKWFCCPKCSNACRVLYGHPAACRECHGLKYASQSEARHWRANRRADTIRRKLGSSGSTDAGLPPKPPRMRWVTYWNLANDYARATQQWAEGMGVVLETMRERQDRR
jgi:hypothetical protein